MIARSSRSTLSPVAAETGTISANVPSSLYCCDDRQQLRLLDQIDLVQDQEHRRRRVLHQVDARSDRPCPAARSTSTTSPSTSTSRIVSTAVSTIRTFIRCSGRWMPGRVEEHDLRVGIVPHAQNARPRRLRLVGDDRQLGADQPVEQRRLAGVGTADERDEPGLHDDRRSRPRDRRCRAFAVLVLACCLHPHLVDPPPLGVEHLDGQAVDARTARRPPARGRGATADSRRRSRTPRARSGRSAAARPRRCPPCR